MVRFTRTFHTVGQGAFYSEKIEYNDKQVFRMVYDCGSKSIPESLLAKRIKSDLANNVDIDILFISHFDKDHINGIYNLNPKLIIIPFLSKDQIFLLKLYNELYENVYDIKLAETPEELFQEAEVIRVLPDDSNNDDSNTFSEININIDQPHKRKNIKKLKSKSIIQLSTDVNSLWEYIPYNPNWNKYAESFKEKILEEDLDWEKLTNPSSNSSYIKKNLSILKNIYDKLGKKNLHSLIVYSNSTIDNCIPRQRPRNGILFSLAYLMAVIFPSIPRSPNPPGTRIPCTSPRTSATFSSFSSSESTHLIFTVACWKIPPCFNASTTEI